MLDPKERTRRRSATCLRTQVGTVSKGASVQGVAGVALLVGRGRKLTVLALLPRQGREEVSVMQGDHQVRLVRVWGGLGRTSTALSKPICSFCEAKERSQGKANHARETRGRWGLGLGLHGCEMRFRMPGRCRRA